MAITVLNQMKKLLAILLLLSLNLSAAEEGLLHQWRFDQTKESLAKIETWQTIVAQFN